MRKSKKNACQSNCTQFHFSDLVLFIAGITHLKHPAIDPNVKISQIPFLSCCQLPQMKDRSVYIARVATGHRKVTKFKVTEKSVSFEKMSLKFRIKKKKVNKNCHYTVRPNFSQVTNWPRKSQGNCYHPPLATLTVLNYQASLQLTSFCHLQ